MSRCELASGSSSSGVKSYCLNRKLLTLMARGRRGAGHRRAFWRVGDADPVLRLFSRGRTRATAPETGGAFLSFRGWG
jgi:hypothetical protein